MKKLLVSALGLAALIGAPARAATLAVVGAGDLTNQAYSMAGATSHASLGLGGGVLLEGSLAPLLGIEFGALYVTRKFNVTGTYSGGGAADYDLALHAMQIPVVVRLHFLPFFSIAAGGYAAFAMGNIAAQGNAADSIGPGISTTDTYAQDGTKTTDYGATFSAQLRMPLAPLVGFLVDARYNLGLTDVTANGSGTKYSDIQVLLGLQLGF